MCTSNDEPEKVVEQGWFASSDGKPGKFLFGSVDEVNGYGAVGVRGFIPSRHELLLLLKHWAKVEMDVQLPWLYYGQTGSDWTRRAAFASCRVNRIAEALRDDEAVREALAEVWAQFPDEIRPRDFRSTSEEAMSEEDKFPEPPK